MKNKKLIVGAILFAGISSPYPSRSQGLNPVLDPPLSGVTASAPVAMQHGVSDDPAARAFADRARGRMLTVHGTVTRLLADDDEGSPHQRFVIRTPSGQTLLVTHNLDRAARLNGLRVNDAVSVHGEYEWNAQGGLMHWTHDDANGQHPAGYIEWKGRRYQ
jgi:hypothetical protein